MNLNILLNNSFFLVCLSILNSISFISLLFICLYKDTYILSSNFSIINEYIYFFLIAMMLLQIITIVYKNKILNSLLILFNGSYLFKLIFNLLNMETKKVVVLNKFLFLKKKDSYSDLLNYLEKLQKEKPFPFTDKEKEYLLSVDNTDELLKMYDNLYSIFIQSHKLIENTNDNLFDVILSSLSDLANNRLFISTLFAFSIIVGVYFGISYFWNISNIKKSVEGSNNSIASLQESVRLLIQSTEVVEKDLKKDITLLGNIVEQSGISVDNNAGIIENKFIDVDAKITLLHTTLEEMSKRYNLMFDLVNVSLCNDSFQQLMMLCEDKERVNALVSIINKYLNLKEFPGVGKTAK
jgi:hypothetical protein